MQALWKVTTKERLLKYCMVDYEEMVRTVLPCCSAAAGHLVEGTVMIMDFGGKTSPTSGDFEALGNEIMACEQQNYPNLIEQMFMINTTFWFRSMWRIGKLFMDKSMTQRMVVLGSNYAQTLLQLIDPENLPAIYGGKCTCPPSGCFDSFAGPFHDLYMQILKEHC